MPTDRIASALQCLTGEHVARNAHRMGAIGAQDISYAIELLRAERKSRADARSTLAQKVLEIAAAEHLEGYIEGEPGEHAAERGRKEDDIAYDNAINHVLAALRELFQREGIEVK